MIHYRTITERENPVDHVRQLFDNDGLRFSGGAINDTEDFASDFELLERNHGGMGIHLTRSVSRDKGEIEITLTFRKL